MALLHSLRSWIDHKLKSGVYELQGGELISGRGRRSEHRLAVAEVTRWQVFPEMGFDVVVIDLADGRQLRWIDTYDDLIGILGRVAADKKRGDYTA
jgi:hypothetical protein